MKKILISLVLMISLFCLSGCGSPKTYDEINFLTLDKMVKEKKDFVLVIGSETCSACRPYRITINKFVEKYGVDIKYIDILKLSEADDDILQEYFSYNATPQTIFVKKGKEVDRLTGNQKYSKVVDVFKDKGYIKEK